MAPKHRKGKKKFNDWEKQGARGEKARRKEPSTALTHPSKNYVESGADRRLALGIFLAAFLVYVSNGGFMTGGDAVANIFFPLQVLRGKFWWKAYDNPMLFTWKRRVGEKFEDIFASSTMDGVVYNKADLKSTGFTGRELLKKKELYFVTWKYMLTPILGDEKAKQRYVNTFNIGTGMTFTPVVAILALFYKFDLNSLQQNVWLLFHSAKVTASILVAASGAFVYLSARTFPSVSRQSSMAIAFIYCFCTCTWSVSSQALWQHGPNEFYLSLANFALLTAERKHADGKGWDPKMVVLCGFSAGMATLSRPTSAVAVASIGAYLLLQKRSVRMSFVYAGAGSILAALQLFYNWHNFDNPLEFGQQQASRMIAEGKTGSPDLWQTPVLRGGATLLFSPSRGLFVFSPLTVFALPAFYLVWLPTFRGKEERTEWFYDDKDTRRSGNEFEALRPLAVSVLILWITAFKFFDYWGGWCFGYRPILDTMPMVALFLSPVVEKVRKHARMRYLVFALAAWSVAVQYVGATACLNGMWDSREAYIAKYTDQQSEVILDERRWPGLKKQHPDVAMEHVYMDIDKPEYRHRLWSWSDWQILYYMQRYKLAKEMKPQQMDDFMKYG